jgi:sodium transport system permease protein
MKMWGNVRLLFQKEITGAIRDRRTLFLTVFFPLIFYPLLFAVMGHMTGREQEEARVPTVIVVDRSQDGMFRNHLLSTEDLSPLLYADPDRARADLKAGLGQVMMTVDRVAEGEGTGLDITLYYDHANQVAALAATRVQAFLGEYLEDLLRTKLGELGLDYDALSPPLRLTSVDVASSESVGRMILSRLLPYFMVLAILTGAMGLGAEITAGEKERGTIATLLVSQLSRTEIVVGKFVTILTISLVSSLLSALGLLIGIRFAGEGLVPMGMEATYALGWETFVWLFIVLIPLAIILSALVIIVGSFARNQKEAAAYLMPVYMLVILIGMVSMGGGAHFIGTRFLIPVANAIYALQEIVTGTRHLWHLVYTLGANLVCGGVLIFFAIQIFKREAVLFRS